MKRIARSYSHREQMRERCLQTLALIQDSKLQLMQSDGLIEWCGKFGLLCQALKFRRMARTTSLGLKT